MSKPIIGITSHIGNNTEMFFEEYRLSKHYVEAIYEAGGIPIVLPIVSGEKDIERQMKSCDGILLSGGDDINPLLYGEEPRLELGAIHTYLDKYQIALTKQALHNHKAILAICRGMQILNVSLGGTLYQDLRYQKDDVVKHRQNARRHEVTHYVEVNQQSKMYELFGDRVEVNSYHHQSIRRLGEGLRVTGESSDGTIEMVETTGDTWIVGVQWHPEGLFKHHNKQKKLFEEFVDNS